MNALTKHLMCFCVAGLLTVLSATGTMRGAANDLRVVTAAMNGDIEAVRNLIREAADVNTSLGDGTTALHWAAEKDDAEMAQLLIYAGANIRATTRIGGYTPLFMAARRGAAPVVDALLKSGSDVNVAAINDMTPLMFAALSGDRESVRLLVEAGADVNAREAEHGQTALIFAAAYDRADVVEELVEHQADLDLATELQEPAKRPERPDQVEPVGVRSPPQNAPAPARDRRQQLQQALLDEDGRNPRSPRGGLTALMYAARDGSVNAIRALVGGGAAINALSADDSTALLIASINGRFDVAKYLVESGADLNLASMDGATPLYGVLHVQWSRESEQPQPSIKHEETSYLDLMKLMLEAGADPNPKLTRQLWYTSYGVARNGARDIGTTPFWKSASVADIDGMQLLLAHGADPIIANKDGVTSLLAVSGAGTHGNDDIEAPQGRMASVRYLVERLSADVNDSDNGDSRRGQQSVQPKQNPANPSGAIGYTALHNAASRGDNEMILYLVSRGANAGAVTKYGVTVADMANGPRQRIQPYAATLALLELLGAKNNHQCVSC